MEELPLCMSRVTLGGNERLPRIVPHAGGGEGLYIAPRHTELLYNTVDDASGLLFRGTGHCTEVQQVQLTLFRSTSCIIGMAKSRTVTPTGQAQHRPVGLTPVAITS